MIFDKNQKKIYSFDIYLKDLSSLTGEYRFPNMLNIQYFNGSHN